MDVDGLGDVTERLERAEDNFLNLIERFPHLIKEPEAIDIIHAMRTAIVDLRSPLQVGRR